ncbi:MAG: TlpA family protein disulfide reductase [Leadbetterella sp.]
MDSKTGILKYWPILIGIAGYAIGKTVYNSYTSKPSTEVTQSATGEETGDEIASELKKATRVDISTAGIKTDAGLPLDIAKYKGKVIYADFWASWCGPCRAGFEHSKKLKNKFEGKDVVFMNVSLDGNKDEWRSAIKSLEIEGFEHYLADDEGAEVGKKYGINEIPRYMILDKTGKIVNDKAPYPSEDEAAIYIEKLLEE